jgi:hypothetical protein
MELRPQPDAFVESLCGKNAPVRQARPSLIASVDKLHMDDPSAWPAVVVATTHEDFVTTKKSFRPSARARSFLPPSPRKAVGS